MTASPAEQTSGQEEGLATTDQPEELTTPEPEQTEAQEVKDLEKLGPWNDTSDKPQLVEKKLYDFPVTINRQVEYYLNFFQHENKKSFSRWLARSGRYIPMIQKQLAEANLPKDLAYLPMIESGYSLTAYSSARAVGPWQFIRSTAINYGLTVNQYVDERRDPIKSTQSAVQYLSNLYSQFGSWPLAVAAYNAGEGKIQKAIQLYHSNNFWELAKHNYLNAETKRYVPKLTAAIIIAKNPQKYGFSNLQYQKPLAFDTAEVPPWTSLRAVALACGTDFKILQNLNRSLRQAITPPSQDACTIKVPVGKKDLLDKNLPRVYASVSTHYKTHIIRHNDTISRICRTYQISRTTLLKANNLHKAKLRQGHYLRIPYQTVKYTLLTKEEYKQRQKLAESKNNKDLILHKVKPGETVSQIAEHYNVPSRMIASWNDLRSINQIRAGQQIAIYIHNSSPQIVSRTASMHKLYYQVQGGDNLWTIAKKFNTDTDSIKRWNNLKDNIIHPGLKLVLEMADDG